MRSLTHLVFCPKRYSLCAATKQSIKVWDLLKWKVGYIRTSDHNDQLKLGASSSEEAARWIHCLKDAALKESPGQVKNFVASPKKGWPSLSLGSTKTTDRKNSVNWPFRSSVHAEAMTSDVMAPSPWKIFGCQNGKKLSS